MQKINFEDLPSTNTPIIASNLNAVQTNVEDAFKNNYSTSTTDTYSCDYINNTFELKGTVLYNDSGEGSNTSIVLYDDVSNYDYIEIFYRTNDKFKGSSKFTTAPITGNNYLQISVIHPQNNRFWVKACEYEITQGTNLTLRDYYEYSQYPNSTSGTISNVNQIYIIKIIGYK